MNNLLDAAETAASGRQQQWFWYRKPKAAVVVGSDGNSDFTFGNDMERQCGTTTRIYKNYKKTKRQEEKEREHCKHEQKSQLKLCQ